MRPYRSQKEEAGRADGCTTASVDTFSFQAPDFYPRQGYREVFRYPLSPPACSRYALSQLSSDA